jgi:L-ascorbate metabolism protein UlaG (beta-lactamase superfamily)
MKISDHCDGKRYFNPGSDDQRSWRDLLRWKLAGGAAPWPKRVDIAPREAPARPESDGAIATWIGHSTVLIQTRQVTYLTDPVYRELIGPVSWAGPRRVACPGVPWESLPKIDAVLLSHDHFDHCDLPSLRRLAQRDAPVFWVPLGHRQLLEAAGVGGAIHALDWWEAAALPSGATLTFVPALHWCRRSIGATDIRLWGGFLLRSGGRRIYYAGDTGYDGALFSQIREWEGPPDLALLPIGAYEPRWIMRGVHMNPEEAVQAHLLVGAHKSLGVHWGTFQLTDEAREAPVTALEAAKTRASIPGDAFVAVAPGASVSI